MSSRAGSSRTPSWMLAWATPYALRIWGTFTYFLYTSARYGEYTQKWVGYVMRNASHPELVPEVHLRAYTRLATVILPVIPPVITRAYERMLVWGAVQRQRVVHSPRFPTFRSSPATRTLLVFSLFCLSMGLTLLIIPDKVRYLYLSLHQDAVAWSVIYGAAFLVAAIAACAGSFVWPALNLNQQLWVRTAGYGSVFGVTLGWSALIVIAVVEHTGNLAALLPWMLILYFEATIFNRYTAIQPEPPRGVRRRIKRGRT